MNLLRKHWYDLGCLFAICVGVYLFRSKGLNTYNYLIWISLISLFLHQLEEYRVVGTFPGMINSVMFKSDMPDRYPLNTNTAFIINVWIGWLSYFLAAIFGDKAVWLGIATIIISLGNIVAHTVVFNVKGKTVYNAGMATSWIFFAPVVYLFFKLIIEHKLATPTDYLVGILLGILLNIVGIFKMITWLADKDTGYIFEQRNLLAKDRKDPVAKSKGHEK